MWPIARGQKEKEIFLRFSPTEIHFLWLHLGIEVFLVRYQAPTKTARDLLSIELTQTIKHAHPFINQKMILTQKMSASTLGSWWK